MAWHCYFLKKTLTSRGYLSFLLSFNFNFHSICWDYSCFQFSNGFFISVVQQVWDNWSINTIARTHFETVKFTILRLLLFKIVEFKCLYDHIQQAFQLKFYSRSTNHFQWLFATKTQKYFNIILNTRNCLECHEPSWSCNHYFELQSRMAQKVSFIRGQKVPLHNLPIYGNTKSDLNEFPDHRVDSIAEETL